MRQTTAKLHLIDCCDKIQGHLEGQQLCATLRKAATFDIRLSGRQGVLAHTRPKRQSAAGCQGRQGGWAALTASR
jgi:hypothetical protein